MPQGEEKANVLPDIPMQGICERSAEQAGRCRAAAFFDLAAPLFFLTISKSQSKVLRIWVCRLFPWAESLPNFHN
jgi:hypothetical protein